MQLIQDYETGSKQKDMNPDALIKLRSAVVEALREADHAYQKATP